MDHATFLRTIIASPADDGPRLVYADWLEEQGESERAEFIRVQVELSQFNAYFDVSSRMPIPRSDRLESLHRRESDLLRDYGHGWLAGIGIKTCNHTDLSDNVTIEIITSSNLGGGIDLRFRRGFAESAVCPWADWRDYSTPLLAREPVTHVELTTTVVVNFGPIVREQSPGPFGTVTFVSWVVECDGDTKRFGMRHAILRDQTAPDQAAYLEAKITSARTIIGYLESRWPGIRFSLPSDALTLTAHRLATAMQVPAELLRGDTDGLANSVTYAAARAAMEEFDRRMMRMMIAERDWVDGATQ